MKREREKKGDAKRVKRGNIEVGDPQQVFIGSSRKEKKTGG